MRAEDQVDELRPSWPPRNPIANASSASSTGLLEATLEQRVAARIMSVATATAVDAVASTTVANAVSSASSWTRRPSSQNASSRQVWPQAAYSA